MSTTHNAMPALKQAKPFLTVGPLSDAERRLLAVFYRHHGSKMTGARQTHAWVASAPSIVGALCLTQLDTGHWLTGLLVDPAFRGQGVASRLLHDVRQHIEGPIWLFCRPALQDFYLQRGYRVTADLPPVLAQRLARYQQSKTLLAMCHSAP